MKYYFHAWKNSFDFSGRTSNKEFWLFMVVHILITIGCAALDILTAIHLWFDLTYGLLSFIPMISCIARRLHDSGKSGCWGFVFFIPAVGPIALIYLLTQPSIEYHLREANV